MTTDPSHIAGSDRERRTADLDRREPIQPDAPGDRVSRDRSLEYRCQQVSAALCEALGLDGCSALLDRALAECEPKHPVLKHMRGRDGREIQLTGISVAVERHGYDAAEAGVDAILTSLVGILGKLIGEDMALRLLDLDTGDFSENQESL